MRALETTDLGHAPSPMCGLEDSNREMTFVCGIEGSEPERRAELEQLVESTLQKVVDEGISQERLEAILHQLELHQREIAGDSFPYGLQLIRSEEHTSELQSRPHLVCRLLLEKKKKTSIKVT